VDRVTFTNCTNCTITTILSGGGTGFAAFGFSNITVNGGTLFYCQDDKVTDYTGYTHRPISFTFITLTNNARLFGGVFAGVVTDWGFWPLVDHVTIDATSRDTDAGNNGGVAPIWQNITREDPTASCGIKIDEFTATLTTNFVPMTDRTRFGNANALPAHQLAVIDPSLLVNYPTGFMTTCFSASATNWYLKADAAWNTWPSDINVTSGGITIRFNGTLFDRIG
jgi:hypothetical protein